MILENAHVRLEPLALAHVDALTTAAQEDRGTFGLAPVPRDRDEMLGYVEAALLSSVPFAIVRRADERVVGSTRLMSLEWWSWPPGAIHVEGEPRRRDEGDPPDVAEIGHVWLTRAAQRTVVNTASCVLLMTHAFETWRVHRLVLKTDARNERSRAAIERLGGTFEGILRKHQPAADGVVRDTAMFSIIRSEWPPIKERLAARLA